tara:strand:+ start:524 stop:697 length:174 start_codon:yes stop_codon:yes gene_type:complete
MIFNQQNFIEKLNNIYNNYNFKNWNREHLEQYLKYLETYTIDEYYKKQINQIKSILN